MKFRLHYQGPLRSNGGVIIYLTKWATSCSIQSMSWSLSFFCVVLGAFRNHFVYFGHDLFAEDGLHDVVVVMF